MFSWCCGGQKPELSTFPSKVLILGNKTEGMVKTQIVTQLFQVFQEYVENKESISSRTEYIELYQKCNRTENHIWQTIRQETLRQVKKAQEAKEWDVLLLIEANMDNGDKEKTPYTKQFIESLKSPVILFNNSGISQKKPYEINYTSLADNMIAIVELNNLRNALIQNNKEGYTLMQKIRERCYREAN